MSRPALVTLRDLARARMFPMELDAGKSPARRTSCARCDAPTSEVVITTGGPYGDPAVWEAHPIAIDGWRCERCDTFGFPVSLSPEEITALGNEGVAAARAGRLDDGELALRRAIASWPGYSPPRVNLGALYLDRIRDERAGANRPAVIERLIAECERQLRRARMCEPPAPPEAAFMLARLLASTNRPDEARALFAEVSDSPHAPGELRADAVKRLLALGGARAVPRTPAKRRRVTSWHVVALILGASGLFLSRGIATTDTYATVLPIASALLVAWFVSRLVPIWVAAVIPVAVGVLAVRNVRGIADRQRSDQAARLLDYAITDVCDGKPLGRDPNGPRVRVLDAYDDRAFWHGDSWPAGKIPAYVLCTRHRSEEVSCGDYVDDAHPDRGVTRLCNARDVATAELRETRTAEVVWTKSYVGPDPAALTGYVQLGGAGSTRLSGGMVSYEEIYADIKGIITP